MPRRGPREIIYELRSQGGKAQRISNAALFCLGCRSPFALENLCNPCPEAASTSRYAKVNLVTRKQGKIQADIVVDEFAVALDGEDDQLLSKP